MVVPEGSPRDSDADARSHDAVGDCVGRLSPAARSFSRDAECARASFRRCGLSGPYSDRLFEYFLADSGYVLRAAPLWERGEGTVLGFSPPDLT